MVEPNVIPLVDIMLVLLIIMIITVPVMTHAVKIDLPKEVNRPTETKPENINLSIDFDGSIYWNENSVDKTQLLNYVLEGLTAKEISEKTGDNPYTVATLVARCKRRAREALSALEANG